MTNIFSLSREAEYDIINVLEDSLPEVKQLPQGVRKLKAMAPEI